MNLLRISQVLLFSSIRFQNPTTEIQGWYNATMQNKRVIILLMVTMFAMILSACTPIQSTPTMVQTDDNATLQPYPSDTPTQTPLPTGYSSPTPSPTITPTWTPVVYKVKENDDMFGIALWYGVSLEALKTANPTVNPYAMGAGTLLLIPLTPQAESTPRPTIAFTPTPTPKVALQSQPDCYPGGSGGLICFALVENTSPGTMENVGGTFTLKDNDSGATQDVMGITPLNLLKPGDALPVVAYFNAPLPKSYTISVVIDVMLPVMPDDSRYVELTITDQNIGYDEARTSATISGKLALKEGTVGVRSVWVLAIAYDEAQRVVGFRRWESLTPEKLTPDVPQAFKLNIYSLQGAIDQIVVITEAKALLP